MRSAVLQFLFLSLFIGVQFAFAQDADPSHIIGELNSKLNKVKDYEADIYIKADISFLKVLPVRAKIYFKQPDKVRVQSKGLVVLPRQGFDLMSKLVRDSTSFDYIVRGKETIRNISTQVLTLIPVSDTMDIILGKFWVDTEKWLILKSQITTRTNGTVSADYFFASQESFGLPDSIVFSVDVKKFKIPKAVSADINAPSTEPDHKSDPRQGKIRVLFSKYAVNKGVSDSVFSD